jgi:hypothetical protein
MKPINLLFFAFLFCTCLFAQDQTQDPTHQAAMAFINQLEGAWELVEEKELFSLEPPERKTTNIKMEVSKTEYGIGLSGYYDWSFVSDSKESNEKGLMQFIYNRPQRVLRYMFSSKRFGLVDFSLRYHAGKWISSDPDGGSILVMYYDEFGHFILESSIYEDQNVLLETVVTSMKKVN